MLSKAWETVKKPFVAVGDLLALVYHLRARIEALERKVDCLKRGLHNFE